MSTRRFVNTTCYTTRSNRLETVLQAGLQEAWKNALKTDAPKRTDPEAEPFDLEWWLNKFAELKFVDNFDKWMRDEDVLNFHWAPNYSKRQFAIEIDEEKNKVVALFKELNETAVDTFPKLVAMHINIADNMEMMRRDPYAQLWGLMKVAMEDAIESFSLDWEWYEGSLAAAEAGSGAHQHGFFIHKNLKKSKKGKKGKTRR